MWLTGVIWRLVGGWTCDECGQPHSSLVIFLSYSSLAWSIQLTVFQQVQNDSLSIKCKENSSNLPCITYIKCHSIQQISVSVRCKYFLIETTYQNHCQYLWCNFMVIPFHNSHDILIFVGLGHLKDIHMFPALLHRQPFNTM